MFGRRQKTASSFNKSHHGQSTPSRSNIVEIVMHDVNIEEIMLETSVIALLLFARSG